MRKPTTARAAAAALATAVAVAAPIAVAATPSSHTVKISAQLKVTATEPPSCSAGVCTIKNHGTGTMKPYGVVTFKTVILADGKQPPCGKASQWVNRIVRTIKASKGKLVLHEAGLQCPKPGVGAQVRAVWAVDGQDSTGIFHGATGSGHDVAYPAKDTAAPHGTITLGS